MKKLVIIAILFLFSMPLVVFSDMISFRVGYFMPQAKSNLWAHEFDLMDFEKSDFQDIRLNLSYEHFISRELSVVISAGRYSKETKGNYRDYFGKTVFSETYAYDQWEGYEISHYFSVSNIPIQASIKLTPMGRKGRFIPYLGGGTGLHIWSARVLGDVIDFNSPRILYSPSLGRDVTAWPAVSSDIKDKNRIAFGLLFYAGIMIPISDHVSADGQFKYEYAKGGIEAFSGYNNFDLGGYQLAIGINYLF